jgi:hypothetical protein
MQRNLRTRTVLVLLAATVPIAACGHKKNEAAGTVTPPPSTSPINPLPDTTYPAPTTGVDTATAKTKHHSKLKGAVIGGAAGHAAGHGAMGAAAGAIVQHERNKHKQ